MSISFSVLAFRIESCDPFVRAASGTSRIMGSLTGLFGFTSTAITLASGTSSEISSIRFGISSTLRMVTPVRFSPGRARLSISPVSTASLPVVKTIGIVEVAVFAARAEAAPPTPPTFILNSIRYITEHWEANSYWTNTASLSAIVLMICVGRIFIKIGII